MECDAIIVRRDYGRCGSGSRTLRGPLKVKEDEVLASDDYEEARNEDGWGHNSSHGMLGLERGLHSFAMTSQPRCHANIILYPLPSTEFYPFYPPNANLPQLHPKTPSRNPLHLKPPLPLTKHLHKRPTLHPLNPLLTLESCKDHGHP